MNLCYVRLFVAEDNATKLFLLHLFTSFKQSLKKKEEDFTVTLYITFTDREEHRVAKASPSHPSRMRFEDLKSQKID